MSRIESNSAAYLQHISMMIAAIGLLLAGFSESLFEQVVLVVMIGFLILAFACIRCLYHVPCLEMTDFQPQRAEEDFWNEREKIISVSEVAFREDTLAFCTRWMRRLKIAFALTVFVHLLVSPIRGWRWTL